MVLRKEQKDHAALASPNTSICVSDWQPPPAKLLKSAALSKFSAILTKCRGTMHFSRTSKLWALLQVQWLAVLLQMLLVAILTVRKL